jgi:hypothetical protein
LAKPTLDRKIEEWKKILRRSRRSTTFLQVSGIATEANWKAGVKEILNLILMSWWNHLEQRGSCMEVIGLCAGSRLI